MFALLLLSMAPEDVTIDRVPMPTMPASPRPLPPDIEARVRKMEELSKMPRQRTSGDVIYAALRPFRGKPARYAFDRLGYPDRKIIIEGATVYSWLNEASNLDGSPLRCTVKVIVRAAKIASTDFFGNGGACARFARALDPTYRHDY